MARDVNGIDDRYIKEISEELGIDYDYCYGVVRDIFYYYNYCVRKLKYRFIRIDGVCRIRPNAFLVYCLSRGFDGTLAEEMMSLWLRIKAMYSRLGRILENEPFFVKRRLALMRRQGLSDIKEGDIVRFSGSKGMDMGLVLYVGSVNMRVRVFRTGNIIFIRKKRCALYG